MTYIIVKNYGTKDKPNQQASLGGGADVAAALRDYNDAPLFNEDHEINPPPRVLIHTDDVTEKHASDHAASAFGDNWK